MEGGRAGVRHCGGREGRSETLVFSSDHTCPYNLLHVSTIQCLSQEIPAVSVWSFHTERPFQNSINS